MKNYSLIDKTGGLRPYQGGLYQFVFTYLDGNKDVVTSNHKMDYKKHLNNVKQVVIDLL